MSTSLTLSFLSGQANVEVCLQCLVLSDEVDLDLIDFDQLVLTSRLSESEMLTVSDDLRESCSRCRLTDFLELFITELTLTGSPSAIEAAREIIESLNAPRQRRERDDY